MYKKLLLSLLVMVMAMTAVAGATFAWFTAETDPIENTFTAGTVIIEADEEVIPEDFVFDNWNPGDCVEKEFTVTNTGSKNIYLRASLSGQWQKKSGSEWVAWEEGDASLVTIQPVGDTAGNWEYLEVEGVGYWHYNGELDGTFAPEENDIYSAVFRIKVCLSGPNTTNEYQGKRYVLSTVFQAVQSSHNASDDVWAVTYDGTEWTLVED